MKILSPVQAAAFAVVTVAGWTVGALADGAEPGSLIAAFLVGAGQAVVLRMAQRPHAPWWAVATVAGAFAGGLLASRLAFAHPMLAIPVTAAVIGALEGALQGLVLRSSSRAAPAWIFLAPLSWLAAGVALVATGTLQTASFGVREIAIFGSVIAVVQGLALALLPRRVIQ